MLYDISTSALAGYPAYLRRLTVSETGYEISTEKAYDAEKYPDFDSVIENQFFGMIKTTIEAAKTDVPLLAECLNSMSVPRKFTYRFGWLIKPIAKFIQKLKIGTVYKWVKKDSDLLDDFIKEKTGDECVLVPIGDTYQNGIFTLNEDAEKLFDLLNDGKSRDEIIDFFAEPHNQALLQDLLQFITLQEVLHQTGNTPWKGKTFVLTGTLPTMSREEASDIIKSHGGKTSSSVSKKTDYVLAGENAGSKLDKAQNLGVIILTEEDFLDMIKD